MSTLLALPPPSNVLLGQPSYPHGSRAPVPLLNCASLNVPSFGQPSLGYPSRSLSRAPPQFVSGTPIAGQPSLTKYMDSASKESSLTAFLQRRMPVSASSM